MSYPRSLALQPTHVEGPEPPGHPESRLRLGVVIPAYNEETNLPHMLAFLENFAAVSVHRPVDLEVWVDVSGSTDRTGQIAVDWSRQWDAVHIVDSGRRDGLLSAMDRLLSKVRGDLILRIDADLHFTPLGLDSLISTLRTSRCGIVGPRVVPARSPSVWVTRLSRTEFAIHHRVSLRAPKTTLVQLFQGVPVRLRPDSGVEDVELQLQITKLVGPAVYDPESVVVVMPPVSLRDYLFQRVRTIRHVHAHARRGYGRSPTDSLPTVGAAILDTLRARDTPFRDLALFLVVEGFARLAAAWTAVFGREDLFTWTPLEGTKQPTWGASAHRGGGLTVASEDAVPILLR
jgi:Glycosyl transferase family 2